MTRDEVLAQYATRPFSASSIADAMADEIVRLRGELRDMHTKVFHLEEKLAWTERERDQLTSLPAERILAALRAPSEKILLAAVEAVPYGASYAALQRCLPAAVTAAEQEVAGDNV